AAARVRHVEEKVRGSLPPRLGFEVYPFKVGWYNGHLKPSFHLPYPADTLGLVVFSTPRMFTNAFKPFIKSQRFQNIRDPIDECVAYYFSLARENFPDEKVDIMYDYDLLPNRRPKVLVQTAAHVAGAAYYYQRTDVKKDPWGEKKIYGVCIHPRYGGWFAIRGVLIFPDVEAAALEQRAPIDCVETDEKRIELLERFNFHWRDWSYRDVVEVEESYSEEQRLYFATPPGERLKLLRFEEDEP
uniref:Cyanocobalamin reductase / alkylcobalamin dealkylase n=1 Tax=Latimeria chalumnae TaxID=7897 RepID=H3B573_LATCH